LVVDTHLADIGGQYWRKQLQHAPSRILEMSVNEVSTVLVAAYLVINALRGSSGS
jgi:hypothetical protein